MNWRSNNLRGDYGYGYYATNNNDAERWSIVSQSVPVQVTPDGGRGTQDLWSFEEIESMMRQWSIQEDSRLPRDEQKKALTKLKKEIYNPVPMSIGRRLNLYYRDKARNIVNEKPKERDEDGKRCAVCLDDFEPKEWVVVTPCNHMFHEDCIVPWMKSHERCPVCRFAIS